VPSPAHLQNTKAIQLRYISTRGEAPELGFEDALLTGLARDGGLYVPKVWPLLGPETIAGFAGKPFAEVAATILDAFAGGTISRAELLAVTSSAYDRFGHPAVTPLTQLGRAVGSWNCSTARRLLSKTSPCRWSRA
jgi:threonine synthase